MKPAPDGRSVEVELILLNSGDRPVEREMAATLTAEIDAAGSRTPVTLTRMGTRMGDQPARVPIPAGGFVRLRYRLDASILPATPALLSLPALGIAGVAVDRPGVQATPRLAAAAPPPPAPPAAPAPAPAVADPGGVLLGRLTTYEPIYAVYGPGTDSDARLQFSLKYQPFASRSGRSLLDHVELAYTQRIFWDLGRKSSPFHNVDYIPELFYLMPEVAISPALALGGQAGFRHESNGRDGDDSRSFNTLYLEPLLTMPFGGGRLSLGPRVWAYVGRRSDNPDIAHYRGNTGLTARYLAADGLHLDLTARLNPGSGKGALDALASYPLTRLAGPGVHLYLVGQAFAGYGETLLDYDRQQTRLRVGLGIVP